MVIFGVHYFSQKFLSVFKIIIFKILQFVLNLVFFIWFRSMRNVIFIFFFFLCLNIIYRSLCDFRFINHKASSLSFITVICFRIRFNCNLVVLQNLIFTSKYHLNFLSRSSVIIIGPFHFLFLSPLFGCFSSFFFCLSSQPSAFLLFFTALLFFSPLLLQFLSSLFSFFFLLSQFFFPPSCSLGLKQFLSSICCFLFPSQCLLPLIGGNVFVFVFNYIKTQVLIDLLLFKIEFYANLTNFFSLLIVKHWLSRYI